MSDSNSFCKVVRLLPIGTSAHEYADACRIAARALLESRGWGKRELAAWLIVQYAPLVASAPRHRRVVPMTRQRPISEADILALLAAARREVRSALVGRADWIDDVVQRGWVRNAIDEWGDTAYMAWSEPNMRLADRLLSLLAADYLTRHENERVARTSEARIIARQADGAQAMAR